MSEGNIDNPLRKLGAPTVRVQTTKDYKERNLTPPQLLEYCRQTFPFEEISVRRFKSWSDNRVFQRNRREQAEKAAVADLGRPTLPSHVKLITVSSMEPGSQRQFIMNPRGKTSVAVLHEYVQRILKGEVKYIYGETREAQNPYTVTVKVSKTNRKHGKSFISSTSPVNK